MNDETNAPPPPPTGFPQPTVQMPVVEQKKRSALTTMAMIAGGIILGFGVLMVGCLALVGGVASNVSEEMEAQDARVIARITDCSQDSLGFWEATGRVTNRNDVEGDVFVEVNFTDRADGVLLYSGNDWVRNLKPDGVGNFSAKLAKTDIEQRPTCSVNEVNFTSLFEE